MAALALTSEGRHRREDRLGLIVAILFHLALIAFLLVRPPMPEPAPPAERMAVSLVEDVGLESVAPTPVPESRAAVAPTLSDIPVPSAPPPAPPTRSIRSAEAIPQPKPTQRSAPRPEPSKAPSGGSRIGADFLAGQGASDRTEETRTPGTKAGAQATASIQQAVARQIKPHWNAPQGVDAEKLVTVLAFNLNPDGSLNGRPRVVSQSGVTDANATQKALHAERAIRAVQLAAPFDLPDEYYDSWKRISSWTFDRRT